MCVIIVSNLPSVHTDLYAFGLLITSIIVGNNQYVYQLVYLKRKETT